MYEYGLILESYSCLTFLYFVIKVWSIGCGHWWEINRIISRLWFDVYNLVYVVEAAYYILIMLSSLIFLSY